MTNIQRRVTNIQKRELKVTNIQKRGLKMTNIQKMWGVKGDKYTEKRGM